MFGTGRSPATQHMGLKVSPCLDTGWSCVLAGCGWPPADLPHLALEDACLACCMPGMLGLLFAGCPGRQYWFVARVAQECRPALAAGSTSVRCFTDACPNLCITRLTVLQTLLTLSRNVTHCPSAMQCVSLLTGCWSPAGDGGPV